MLEKYAKYCVLRLYVENANMWILSVFNKTEKNGVKTNENG